MWPIVPHWSFHLSLSSAAFSASSSFCSAVPSLSCARSNSSSTSWILRFRAATSASAWKYRIRGQGWIAWWICEESKQTTMCLFLPKWRTFYLILAIMASTVFYKIFCIFAKYNFQNPPRVDWQTTDESSFELSLVHGQGLNCKRCSGGKEASNKGRLRHTYI